MKQVLSDIHVVEVAGEVAGGWCGKVLADLGADVVKVEGSNGDRLREHPGSFVHVNTNKRSVRADAGSEEATRLLWGLLERADLVIESAGAGTLADWGIDRDEALARFPALVVVGISGFGATGPYADYRWSDIVAQAFSGALLSQGDADQGPVRLPMDVLLATVGQTAALGALGAVLRSRASGAGAFVDCAAYELIGSPPSRIGRYLGWEYRGRQALTQVSTATLTLIPTGVFPCGDGFVAMMSTPQQLNEMLEVLGDDDLKAAFAKPGAFGDPETKEILDGVLYPWLFSHTREEITQAAQAGQWPLAGVNEPFEVMLADHLHQRGFWVDSDDPRHGHLLLPGAPYRFTEGGWRLHHPAPLLGEHTAAIEQELTETPVEVSRVHARAPELPPLHGIRVLDFTTVWSGPFLTLLLGDLGAEVIRVENPSVFPPTTKGYLPRPDPTMMLGANLNAYAPPVPERDDRPYNRHAMNNSVGRGKLSCTLDVRRPEARELFMDLIAQSDVFVENLKASTLHQIGIHETQLLQRNPRLVILRIPPSGLSGDWGHYTGFGAQFDGLTGLAWLCGHRDADLTQTPATTHMDGVTGPAGALAILAALHYRDTTGRGQVIELAQSENVLAQLGDVFVDLQLGVPAERFGNRDRRHAPQGVYRCADDAWLAVTAIDDESWGALAAAIGRDDLANDPGLADLAGRQARHDELDTAIAAWAMSLKAYDGFHALQAAGVAAAPMADDAMLASDPHVAAREWIRPLPSLDVGTYDHLGPAYKGIPLTWERGSPVLGQDNEYVYKELLGVDDERYQRLVAEQIITDDYLDKDGNPY